MSLNREFLALVTSIPGPLEDEIADRSAMPAERRERLKTLQRNIVRLLQISNMLFSMMESGSGRRSTASLAIGTDAIPRLRSTEHDPRPPTPQPAPHQGGVPAWVAELERTNQELEAFSHSVSHDLRGPLRAIDGFSQVLLSDHAHALDHGGRALLQQIHSSAGRMAAIADALLALSQAGRAELRCEPIDLTAIARRVLANLRLREPSRGIELHLRDGLTAICDGRLLALALENLFGNAWKFTRKRRDARIAFDREPGGVFVLHDNGAGFDMDRADRLFEPFERLHGGGEFEGTGIGLAIVRRIIERHGGQVWAHGVVDGGAAFRFTLSPNVP